LRRTADGRQCLAARPRRYPHHRTPLCALGTELFRRHDPKRLPEPASRDLACGSPNAGYAVLVLDDKLAIDQGGLAWELRSSRDHPVICSILDGVRLRLAQLILGAVSDGETDPAAVKRIVLREFTSRMK
jgi:hypothetical protein